MPSNGAVGMVAVAMEAPARIVSGRAAGTDGIPVRAIMVLARSIHSVAGLATLITDIEWFAGRLEVNGCCECQIDHQRQHH